MFNAWSLRACHAESKESPSITSYELQLLFAFDHRAFAGGAGGTEKKKDDGPLVKICRDTSKLATEQVREQIMQSEGDMGSWRESGRGNLWVRG